jgi:hypothetical protein
MHTRTSLTLIIRPLREKQFSGRRTHTRVAGLISKWKPYPIASGAGGALNTIITSFGQQYVCSMQTNSMVACSQWLAHEISRAVHSRLAKPCVVDNLSLRSLVGVIKEPSSLMHRLRHHVASPRRLRDANPKGKMKGLSGGDVASVGTEFIEVRLTLPEVRVHRQDGRLNHSQTACPTVVPATDIQE